jgi:hypothetical protein
MTKKQRLQQIVDFNVLSKIDPRLKKLERYSFVIAKNTPPMQQTNAFYDYCKSSVCCLAGWDSCIPELRTMDVYDTVYQHILGCTTSAAYRKEVFAFDRSKYPVTGSSSRLAA